jgi:hypothetical protein
MNALRFIHWWRNRHGKGASQLEGRTRDTHTQTHTQAIRLLPHHTPNVNARPLVPFGTKVIVLTDRMPLGRAVVYDTRTEPVDDGPRGA